MAAIAVAICSNCWEELRLDSSPTDSPSDRRAAVASRPPLLALVIVTCALVNAFASVSLEAPERSAANCSRCNSPNEMPSERLSLLVASMLAEAPAVNDVNEVATDRTAETNAVPSCRPVSTRTSPAVCLAARPSFCSSTTPALMPWAMPAAFAVS